MHRIYLDNAAATAVDPRVFSSMTPFLTERVGNADSIHHEGVAARTAVQEARRKVALCCSAHEDEILFTSGGTEANNLALAGVARAHEAQGTPLSKQHVVTTAIEHSSVRNTFEALHAEGVSVTYIPVDKEGRVHVQDIVAALTPDTVLVSVQYAQNEVGTVQDIRTLAQAVHTYAEQNGTRIAFHTDAAQAAAWLPLSVEKLQVDLMTLDAQKVNGPQGVGCLYQRRGTPLAPILFGGAQEQGLRPGTVPAALVSGCATAIELVANERTTYAVEVEKLRALLVTRITSLIPEASINGPIATTERLPNILSLCFPGIDGEMLVLALDARGIAASSRSACLRDTPSGSEVLRALGKDDACARGSLRLSLSRFTTEQEVEQAATVLAEVVRQLQATARVTVP